MPDLNNSKKSGGVSMPDHYNDSVILKENRKKFQSKFIAFGELFSESIALVIRDFQRLFLTPFLFSFLIVTIGIIVYSLLLNWMFQLVATGGIETPNQVLSFFKAMGASLVIFAGIISAMIIFVHLAIRSLLLFNHKGFTFTQKKISVGQFFWAIIGLLATVLITAIGARGFLGLFQTLIRSDLNIFFIGMLTLVTIVPALIFSQYAIFLLVYEKNGVFNSIYKSYLLSKGYFWQLLSRSFWGITMFIGLSGLALLPFISQFKMEHYQKLGQFKILDIPLNELVWLSTGLIFWFLITTLAAFVVGAYKYLGYYNVRHINKMKEADFLNSHVEVPEGLIALFVIICIAISFFALDRMPRPIEHEERGGYPIEKSRKIKEFRPYDY